MTFKAPDAHFLVSYDYGMGGLWWYVKAELADEIRDASSVLTVCDEVPDWILEDHWNLIETDDLKNPHSEALRIILAGQT